MAAIPEDVQKYLSEHVYGEMTDESYKIRRNLMVVSVIAFFAVASGISIKNGITFADITFKNVDELKITCAVLIFNLYFLIHFMWIAAHSFAEWRIRLTGIKKSEPITTWWLNQMKNVEKLFISSNDVMTHIDLVNKIDVNNVSKTKELEQSTKNLMFYLKEMKVISDAGVFEGSLSRFDKYYKSFGNSQNLRWLIIELGLPIVVGIYTSYRLSAEIFRLLSNP